MSDVTSVVAVVVAGGAGVVALLALRASRRSAAAAERSAAAAEQSAVAAAREVELAEAAARTAAERPPWQLLREADSVFVCLNDGPVTVFDVSVSGELVDGSPVRVSSLDSRSVLPFVGYREFGREDDDEVTVTWRATPDGELRTWRRPLP